ncbi:MAG: inorganic phosphate transporter [Thermoproteota archaeon]|uniref:Phosphate transporter (TC.PIT) n=2 Tax=environmental samples TaxID=651140 RepID=A0A075GDU5_9ARCH|nr:phosphate transporter (TC.PIT) [uncultured marine thaumarchaeote KM3_04_E09]AIE99862.1 phosphate transporter (TC.PIT) [uncultured marine thaumarchaeote KM3_125_A06]MEA2044239.1 inorganic phosphate transporter [Thermoproteota archaeon]
MLEIAIAAIIIALIFDFVNGFNDSANSVATVIGTRVLRPLQAVALSAAANFAGPFIFGVAVATTIAKGIVSPDEITVYMIIGGLAGAITWSSLCTYFGLPISNSHSLIGGIMGAGIAGLGFEQLVFGGLTKVFAGIIIAPIGGMIFGIALAGAIIVFLAKRRPAIVNRTFGRLQIISSAWFALTHGANDGQKTMGIIVLILFSANLIDEIHMPLWVIFAAASAMGLGTFFGGYKVIKTLGVKVTRLRPYQGFAAETGGGMMLAIFAIFGIPASTTHAITGTIMGAGAARRKRAVRWKVSRQIIFSWVITIPGAAGLGIGFTYIIHLFV